MSMTGVTDDAIDPISSGSVADEWGVRGKLKNYLRGRYFRNVMLLSGGAAVGQAIVLLSTLILTRVYPPEDFGVLAVFVSVVAVIATVSSLRFEIAIPLPSKDLNAVEILVLSLCSLFGTVVVVALTAWMFGAWILAQFGGEHLGPYLWLFPVGVLGVGGYQVFASWQVRKHGYSNLASASITQAVGQSVGQLLLALSGFGAAGLMAGEVFGRICGAVKLLRSIPSDVVAYWEDLTFRGIRSAAQRYWKFPIISSWAALINTLSVQLPLVLLAFFYDLQVVGCVAISQRILGAPTSLLSNSVAKVFLGECARLNNESPSKLKQLYWKTVINQALMSLCLVVGIALPSPWVFGSLFGEQWELAGWCVLLLSATYAAKMVAYPLGCALDVLERQGLHMFRESSRFLCTAVAICAAAGYGLSPLAAVATLSIGSCVAYGFGIWVVWYAICSRVGENAK